MTLGALTDLVQAGKIRYFGHSTWPVSAIVEAQWTAERRALNGSGAEQPHLFDPDPGHRTRRAADLRPLRRRASSPTAPSPADGCPAATARTRTIGADVPGPAARWPTDSTCPCRRTSASSTPPSSSPQLADKAGLSLIELAIAFVLRHPAITSAIIGPRTMEHLESQLPAADVHLTDDVLDDIDTIVPPGVTLNPADDGWVSPTLEPAARRR